jgi:hypothetical protein
MTYAFKVTGLDLTDIIVRNNATLLGIAVRACKISAQTPYHFELSVAIKDKQN